MQLYSDYPRRRTAQIVADALALLIVVVAASSAVAVAAAIRALAQFGRDLEAAGGSFREGLGDAADQLGGVPIIGEGIRAPLDAAAGAGGAVVDAGRGQQQLVESVAQVLGAVTLIVPLLLLAIVWLWPRVRFVRRAGRVRRMLAAGLGADTLAARAVATAPLRRLTAVHPDPGSAYRQGDPRVIRALAALELERAGIRANALP
ncbi:hypothetical protein OVN18_11590 [Microcella daejeonensis]|uniref:Transmembrane protein n=1 Tax=Microcella daejeonensis TaxID=2994971 RepID=A0A9E8S8Q9_9MICO|nr:hypothetical protein [Microcella daejeonensis]WAB81169.1 hypothetical protein OVN18_11590 [Microcella daejeonensis]